MVERLRHTVLGNSISFCNVVFSSVTLLTMPVVLVSLWLWLFFRCDVYSYIPVFGDWIIYWKETGTLHSALFQGGFYGHEELISLASRIFGKGITFTHSIAFPLIQSIFGKVVGWELYTPILWNITILTASLAYFCLTVRNAFLSYIISLFLITFPVVSFQAAMANQEATNVAIAIVFSAMYLRFFTASDTNIRKRYRIIIIFFTFVSAFIRTDWVFSSLPVAMQRDFWPNGYTKKVLVALMLFLVAALPYLFYGAFVAPYPYDLFPGAPKFGLYPFTALLQGFAGPLLDIFRVNMAYLLDPENIKNSPVIVSSLLMVFIVIAGSASSWFQNKVVPDKQSVNMAIIVVGTHIFLMFLLFASYYYMIQAERIMMPHYILCFIALASLMKGAIGGVLIAFNLMFFPVAVDNGRHMLSYDYGEGPIQRLEIAMYSDEMKKKLEYNEHGSPWCNTVAAYGIDPVLLGIPSQVGLVIMRSIPSVDNVKGSQAAQEWLKSKYVYVKNGMDDEEFHNKKHFKYLFSMPQGTFYLNILSKACVAEGISPY